MSRHPFAGRAAAAAALAALVVPSVADAQDAVPPLPSPERHEGAWANPAMAAGSSRADAGEALALPAVEASRPSAAAPHDPAPAGLAAPHDATGAGVNADAATSPSAESALNDGALAGDAALGATEAVRAAGAVGTGSTPGAPGSAGGPANALDAVPAPAVIEGGGFASDPWRSGALMVGLLVALAGGGAALVRLKNKGTQGPVRGEKAMQIVGNLALGPKRRLLLVRVKGEEFVIASTEQGVTFLTGVGAEAAQASLTGGRQAFVQANETRQAALPQPGRSRAAVARDGADADGEAHWRPSSAAPGPAEGPLAVRPGAGSEILTSALRSLREKGLRKPGTADGAASRRTVETRDGDAPRETPPARDVRENRDSRDAKETQRASAPASQPSVAPSGGTATGAFPRYLANAFAEEGRRSLKSESSGDGASGPGEEIQVENVTNLIREKLREMKPLA